MEAIMRRDLLRTGAIALAFAGTVGISAAQQPPPRATPKQQSQQEKAQQTPSGKMGKEEPSAHAPGTQPQPNAAFVNGALAVPGAPGEYRYRASEILAEERGRRPTDHDCIYVQDAQRR